jgi:hypothetical protein
MGDLTAHYDRLTFIAMGFACEPEFEQKAVREAAERGWTFEKIEGSMALLRKCINADWDEDFLVLDPGREIRASHDSCVLCGN